MKTLCIDTSSKACSVAIFDAHTLLWEEYLHNGNTHSCTLLPLITEGLAVLGLEANQLEQFIVSKGPGSFTGLRIGLATVKGLAFASEKPCVGVSTLFSLAHNCTLYDGHVLSVLDARAGQVYAALFAVSAGKVRYLLQDCACTISELVAQIPPNTILVGDGAELVYAQLSSEIPLLLAPIHLRLQRASSVGYAGLALIESGEVPQDYHTLTLSYLRRPQAERMRLGENFI